MNTQLELGLDTFGDVTRTAGGRAVPHAQVIRDVIAEGVLADRVGVDFIGVGEHHREDFAISAPEVLLAAIAGQTERIHLGSAVTVLSSDDPVRVFQRFSTLDAASGELVMLRFWRADGGAPRHALARGEGADQAGRERRKNDRRLDQHGEGREQFL